MIRKQKIKQITFFAAAGWLALLLGCSEQTQDAEPSDVMQTLTGEVFYRERKLLPPGSELHVTLEDVSKMDVSSTVIAASTQSLTGAPPYQFSLDYPAADIDSRMQYSLRAKIMLDGALLFTSTERFDPFKNPGDTIAIKLTMVGSDKSQ